MDIFFISDPARGGDHDNFWNTCGSLEGIDDSLDSRSTIVRNKTRKVEVETQPMLAIQLINFIF